jgi:zinc transport system substrate-binding protein
MRTAKVKNREWRRVVLLLACLTMAFSVTAVCNAREAGRKLTVYTTNYPLTYFTERIAGENAEVVFPAPADVDPAFWTPDKKTVAAYQKADLIMINGATYEKWLDRATLPQFRLINTSAGFKDEYIETMDATTHSHGLDGEHSHSGTAFTTWLDFSQAASQARAIMEALARKMPDKKKAFERNFEALENDLMGLDGDIKRTVAAKVDIPLIASHPIYQYFARRYELNLEAVMWEPGEFPTHEQWAELEYGLKGHPAGFMLWEGEPMAESVKRLEQMAVKSVVFEPCMNASPEGDFMSVMQQNVKNLKTIYE